LLPKSFNVQSNIGPVLNPVQDADVQVQESPANEWSECFRSDAEGAGGVFKISLDEQRRNCQTNTEY